jgi:hypothetical protein
MAVRPGDRLRKRLGGEEEGLVHLGEIRDSQSHIAEIRPREEMDLLPRHQLLRVLDGLRRISLIISEQNLDSSSQQTTRGVDLVHGHLDRLAIRLGETGGDAAVGVDLSNPDRPLRVRSARTPHGR